MTDWAGGGHRPHVNRCMSVVMPCFNEAATVAAVIDRVLASPYTGEVIVVDDGSTDGTSKVVSSFGNVVDYIRKSNGGVASARNAGARAAAGDYVSFVDADDAWAPEKLERQMDALHAGENVGLVYCALSLVDESLRPLGHMEAVEPWLALRNTLLLEKPFVPAPGSSSLIPLHVFDEVGGYDERLSTSADCDLTCRIAFRYSLAAVHEPVVMYRAHGSQMSNRPELLEHDMLIVFDKLFSDDRLPRELAALRERAYANLYFVLAATTRHMGDRPAFFRHLLRALRHDPRRTFELTWRGAIGQAFGTGHAPADSPAPVRRRRPPDAPAALGGGA